MKQLKPAIPAALILIACHSPQVALKPIAPINQDSLRLAEEKKLAERIRRLDASSEFYTISTQQPVIINGKKGSSIRINPANLQTASGAPLKDSITIELKELTSRDEQLIAGAPASSDGQMLITAGSFFLGIRQGDEDVELKPGKTLRIQLPRVSDEPMQLFYGEINEAGRLNWKPAIVGEDTVNLNSLTTGDSYAEIPLTRLGWINVDRFYQCPERTDMYVNFQAADSLPYKTCYLIFKDMNGLIQSETSIDENGKTGQVFFGVPVDARVRLISFSQKNDSLYAFYSDFMIKCNGAVNAYLEPMKDDASLRELTFKEIY